MVILNVKKASVLTKNGEERVISWTNRLMTDADGEIIGLISSGEDITERKIEELKKKKSVENTIKTTKRTH